MNYQQFRTVVTKDFLSGIQAADLFCKALIGAVFTIVGVAPASTENKTLMVDVDNGFRTMRWFLATFLTKVIIASSGVSLLTTIEKDSKVPSKFKVIGFKANFDNQGFAYYSKSVIDFSKLKTKFPTLYNEYLDKDLSYQERGLVMQEFRSKANELFLDSMCSSIGVLKPEIADKFQLGEIHIEVVEWMA